MGWVGARSTRAMSCQKQTTAEEVVQSRARQDGAFAVESVLKPVPAATASKQKEYLGGLVCEQSVFSGVLPIRSRLELSQVTVVVALHLQIKDLRLARGGSGDEMVIEKLQDAGTYVAELLLHLKATNNSASRGFEREKACTAQFSRRVSRYIRAASSRYTGKRQSSSIRATAV